ncbi:MAG: hypothetical protein JWO33_620 [Caulobacteraceae bacterium]|nr:hypothetical protein [Caulobacteraceae bacterium]
MRAGGFAAVLALALAAPAFAKDALPRAPDGHPDLNGVWSNASVTQLNRLPGVAKLVVTEAEAQAMAKANGMVRRAEADARPSKLDDNLLADRNTEAGYNAFWMDPGMTLAKVRGEYRTSWIVTPSNGQLPLNDRGRAQARLGPARQRAAPRGPEDLAPNDRCLIGSRGSGGPGMLNNLYNNSYQIVQTRDVVAIVIEMVHDVRIIPIFPTKAKARSSHRPAALKLWLGDSVGWWEGDTLYVETINVHPEQGAYGPILLSQDGGVTESFRRVSADQIDYAFVVFDPVYYTEPWRAEMSLNAMTGQVYEYACHEGNYALSGMLAGARAEEAKAAGR